METKLCKKCKIEKPVEEFYFNDCTKKYESSCKGCRKIQALLTKERSKNIKIDEFHKYCKKCGEVKLLECFYYHNTHKRYESPCKECHKKLRRNNSDKIKKYNKNYRKKNKLKIFLKEKEYYNTNKDKISKRRNVSLKKKYNSDVSFKLKKNISKNIYKKLNDLKNNCATFDYLPYTVEQLKQHIESLFECWMNWENHGVYNSETWNDDDSLTWTWQLDHIIPHSFFQYTSMDCDEFRQCWALENLRPYSAKQNIIDGNRREAA
jgi:hypothetical protein